MTKTKTRQALALASGGLLTLAVLLPQTANAAPIGQVTHLSGLLSVKRADGSAKVLAIKSEVQEGDLLNTEKDTYARLKFQDGGEVVLRPGTQMKIDAYAFSEKKPETDSAIFSLIKGGFRAVTGLIGKRNRENVSFKAPTATIGIRGTHFGMLFCNNDCAHINTTTGAPPPNGLHLDVAAGAVAVINPAGQTLINTGQFGFVANQHTAPVLVPPAQGVQVTMPQNISQNKGSNPTMGNTDVTQCAP